MTCSSPPRRWPISADTKSTIREPMSARSMMKPARMKNGSANRMKPLEPRWAFMTTAIMSAEPMAMTHMMPVVARMNPIGMASSSCSTNSAAIRT